MYGNEKTHEDRLRLLEARVEGIQRTVRSIETHARLILVCALVVALASINDLGDSWDYIRSFF